MLEIVNWEDLFIRVLNLNLSAAVIVLGILLIRPFLKKAPAWILTALWSLAAFRLLCPFRFSSPASVLPSAETIPQDIALMSAPSVNSGFPAVNSVINEGLQTSFSPNPVSSANPLQIIQFISTWLWLAGIVVCLGYLIISTLLLRRKLRTATLLRDNIRQSELAQTPFVFGFFRPRIYLPYNLPENALSSVIAHEQAHIARRDHWIKPLSFLLLSVNWFNPFLWVAYGFLCRDMENACDERVIRKMSLAERKEYSLALVNLSVTRRFPRATPLAFGENNVKGRVKNILNYKRPGFWMILVSVILCAAAVICLGTDRVKNVVSPSGNQTSYVTCECVYQCPFLSAYWGTYDGNRYDFGRNADNQYTLSVYSEDSGSCICSLTGKGSDWVSVAEEEWDTLIDSDIFVSEQMKTDGKWDKTGWEQLDFGEYRLLRKNDALYIMHMLDNGMAARIHRLTEKIFNSPLQNSEYQAS